MLHLYKSVLIKKQTHLYLGWPEGEYMFICLYFWVSCSFKLHTRVGVTAEYTNILSKWFDFGIFNDHQFS